MALEGQKVFNTALEGHRRSERAEVLRQMSEQARKIEHEAIPQGAEGLYYNKGLFSEALVYHDDEALYFEVRGKENGIVRLSFEMLETLTRVVDEEEQDGEQGDSSQ
jgi:hypothetical protein